MSSIDGAYSPLKVFHHRDRIAQLRDGRQPDPLHVQLVVSDRCNQDCQFCAYRMSGYTTNELFGVINPQTKQVNNNPSRFIPFERIIDILDDCREMGVQAIQVTGGGEPTVHPDHRRIFEEILKRGLNLGLVTNGLVFRSGLPEILARAKWVRVSIDAGKADTYASIRRVSRAAYDKVLNNVRLLDSVRRTALCNDPDHPAKDLLIGVGFVLTKENWREVVDAARTARNVGADNFRISAVFQPDEERYFEGWYEAARDLCREAAELQTERFRVFNMFGDRVEDLAQRSPDYRFCGYQHFTTYIGADLNVYRCCNTAYSTRGLVGSLRDRRFRDLWRSPEKEANFRSFDARACDRCQFNQKNRMILYAMDRAPSHVAFV